MCVSYLCSPHSPNEEVRVVSLVSQAREVRKLQKVTQIPLALDFPPTYKSGILSPGCLLESPGKLFK